MLKIFKLKLNSCILIAFLVSNCIVKSQIIVSNDTSVCFPSTVTLNLTAPCGGDGTTTYAVTSVPYDNTDPYTGTNAFNATTNNKYSALKNIGFTFCYYGNSYTTCVIGNNGIVSFHAAYASTACPAVIGAGAAIPDVADPLNSIMGIWASLAFAQVTTADITYATYGVAPFRRFVVSFNNIPLKACLASLFKAQIKLYESTNAIEINVSAKPICAATNAGRAIEGIQDATGANAVAIAGRNAVSFAVTNDCQIFCPSAANPYTANWYDEATNALVGTGNSITVNPSITTSYIVNVVYACSGQTAADTVTVTVNDVQPSAMNSTVVSCTVNNGTAWATLPAGAQGPFTYAWSPSPQNNQTATGLAAGVQYTVTITGLNGCIGVDTITLQNSGTLVATGGVQNITCNGANNGKAWVTVTAGNPFGYLWSPSGQMGITATGLASGIYTCTIGDANGCTITVTETVIDPPALTVIASPHSVLCNGGNNGSDTADVAGGTGPYTYSWAPAGGNVATAINLSPGTYTVTVTDANGCTISGSSTIINPAAMTITATPNATVCVGGTVTITVTPGGGSVPYTYNWSNAGPNAPTQTVAPLVNTAYTVTVTDVNGCTVSATISVTVNAALTVTPSLPLTVCGGQSVNLTATASGGDSNYTFAWSNGGNGSSITVNPLATTTYTVTVTDGCGSAPAIATVLITVNAAPVVKFGESILKGCPPLSVQFTDQSVSVPPVASWLWDFGDGTSVSDSANPDHIYSTSGYFNVTLTAISGNNCSASASFDSLIYIYPKPTARFLITPPITTLSNAVILFNDESTGATVVNYTNFGDGYSSTERNPYHEYTDTGTFWIHQTVYNQFDCMDSILGTVEILYDYNFYIPSAFTPNAGGLNPSFQGYGTGISNYQMDIYDRYGELIYTTTDMNAPWDGTLNGNDAREGVYVYKVYITDIFALAHTYTGRVTLIR